MKVNFTIRVYALIQNFQNDFLVSDEYRFGQCMTKFPGGGLEYGEGTIECLKREAIEEFGQEINILDHVYTTDFFQQALFHNDTQLISIYYKAKFNAKIQFKLKTKPFDFNLEEGAQSFRWVSLTELDKQLSFPIDKYVATNYCNK